MRPVRKPKKGLQIWAIAFLIWIIAFLFVLNRFGIDTAFAQLSNLDIRWLLLAIVFFIVALFIEFANWKMLLGYLKIKVRLRAVAQIMLAGFFVDDLLPNIAPGGEIAMAYLMHKKTKAPFPKTLASIVMNMISWFVGLISFSFIVLVSLLLFGTITTELAIMLLIFLALFSFFLTMIVYFTLSPKKCTRMISGIVTRVYCLIAWATRTKTYERRTRRLVKDIVNTFHKRISTYARSKKTIVVSCVNLFLHTTFWALSFYFMLLAFGIYIPIELGFAIFITVNLISLLSMVPGQLGIYEVIAATLLSFSTTPVNAVLVTSAIRLLHYWSVVFVGGFFAVKLGLETLTPNINRKK
jgi:uncharacterized protein (TIRG00374 family)